MSASPARNRHLARPDRAWLLLALLLAGGCTLPFLTHAANRLLTGHGIVLTALPGQLAWLLLAPLGLLLASPWLPGSRRWLWLRLLAAALLGNALPWLAGSSAWLLDGDIESLARISFGGGFWLLLLGSLLCYMESCRRLALPPPYRAALTLAALLPAGWLLASGQLDQLSLLREYDNFRDSFDSALQQHVQLVLLSLLPALLLGSALGLLAFRLARLRDWVFPALNIVQTIPSIALFGLLIGPLAWLGKQLPGSGIAGVGMLPAVVALTLYSLLPLARGTYAGLQQVPAEVRDAARGIGMTGWQIFLRVELPLALPVFIGGVRITAVQAVGLAVVAALIGAGGFGAIMFQGLSGSALDQVLLGVLPVVALAIAMDAAFKLAIAWLDRKNHDRDF
ncbi:ABC transporter permease [Vogesella facilis]|uniref:ABC transporter permease n=1 Tax=Vogesella facilis TaxID=1655232 RepID=A0ABV7RF51_9NEIS